LTPRSRAAAFPSVTASGVTLSREVGGVIFDLDDTLIDHRGSARQALRRWLPELGVTPTDELVAAWFGAEERHFATYSSGDITYGEQRRRRLRQFLPAAGLVPGDDDELDDLFAGYLVRYRASWITYDDVGPAVTTLHRSGISLAVLTNGVADQQHAKVASTGRADLLGPVFTAEELGVAKPDPEAYLMVCRHLGLPPSSVVHVGDRYDLDVEGARAAGLQAIHLDRRGTGPLDEPARITSLDQLSFRGPADS